MPHTRLLKIAMIAVGIVVAAMLSADLLINVLDLGLTNNGDGGRVLRSAFVRLEDTSLHTHLPASFPMQPILAQRFSGIVPLSPAGLLSMLIALVSKLCGAERFDMVFLTAAYFAIFYLGCWLLVNELQQRAARMAAFSMCVIFLADPYLVAYFFSVYEEAFTLAVLPLWSYSVFKAFQFEKGVALFFLTTLLVAVSKTSLVLLCIIPVFFCLRYRKPRYIFATSLILAACFLAGAKYAVLFEQQNAFNRLFNGVAYSLSDVSGWPERSFLQRHAQAAAMVRRESFERTGLPAFALAKWGHSYWPDAVDTPPIEMMSYIALGRKAPFLKLLARHPGVALRLIDEPVRTAVVADYTMSYLDQPHDRDAMSGYSVVFQALHRKLGLLLVFAVPLLALGRCRAGPLSAVLTLLTLVSLLSPIFVVLGDGYFEFEKHLLPFLLLIPMSVPILVEQLAAVGTLTQPVRSTAGRTADWAELP